MKWCNDYVLRIKASLVRSVIWNIYWVTQIQSNWNKKATFVFISVIKTIKDCKIDLAHFQRSLVYIVQAQRWNLSNHIQIKWAYNGSDHLYFIGYIRSHNSALSFASTGAQVTPPLGTGTYCFRIHSQIHHNTSHLHPSKVGTKSSTSTVYEQERKITMSKRYLEQALQYYQACSPFLACSGMFEIVHFWHFRPKMVGSGHNFQV